ncbi:hypothetical protein GGI12_000576 [Dipsacomyces acuminosporus]|nr:hypothetical protein GGI12_000576 [Dipsacomyces acuminosporus]
MEKVFKVVMLGGAKSGKTSLRNHFLYTNYSWHYTPTANPDFVATYITLSDGELAAMQIWDTGGQAPSLTVTNSLCYDADGIIFVYDGTSPESLQCLDRHFATVNSIISSRSKHVPVVLVQTKSDLDAQVSSSEAEEFARMYLGSQDIECIAASARTGNNVALAFQTIATMCHTCWLKDQAPGQRQAEPKPRLSRHGDPIAYHQFDIEDSVGPKGRAGVDSRRSRSHASLAHILRSASAYSKLPSSLEANPRGIYRWLEERECRWEGARPVLVRTVETKSRISALSVNCPWVAASCDRFLKVWKVDGAMRLQLNVRENSANRISICASARAVIFSSYLREAKVYSLTDGQLLFGIRSATVPIDQVDIRHDLAAVLKRNSRIEVYQWKTRVLVARLDANSTQMCDMKLCSPEIVVAASTEWQVLVFSIRERQPILELDLRPDIASFRQFSGLAPKLKASYVAATDILHVALYCKRARVSFEVKMSSRHKRAVAQKVLSSHLENLDTHGPFQLSISPSPKRVVCGTDMSARELKIPKPSSSPKDHKQLLADHIPDIAAIDDSTAADLGPFSDQTRCRKYTNSASSLRDREGEIIRLAQDPDTLGSAISLYRQVVPKLPLHSLTPWVLLSRCYDCKSAAEFEWMSNSIRVFYGSEAQSIQELLICAYMHLGMDQRLRESIASVCIRPVVISARTLSAVLVELQGTLADRQLACRLWSALIDAPGFLPSRTSVQLALKLAMHVNSIDLAVKTYQMVLSRRWKGVHPGYWAEKIMIYGLAMNGRVDDAFEVAAATTNQDSLQDEAAAMQTAQKYELLLKGLSKVRYTSEAEAVFEYVRNDLGLVPTVSMYSSLLGLLAHEGQWDKVEQRLKLMEEDGHAVPGFVWKRILLGFAKVGQVDVCNKVLETMASRNIPYTYVVVLAALEAFTRLGNFEMIVRWYHVVHEALAAQSQKTDIQQRAVSIDGTVGHSGLEFGKPNAYAGDMEPKRPGSLLHPEEFVEYFVMRNELIWHRSVLACVLDAAGELGDSSSLMQVWEDIYSFQPKVRTLKMSPYIYMTLSRSLARQGLLGRYEDALHSWISDERNAFSYSQREESASFVKLCVSNHRAALQTPRIRNAAAAFETNEGADEEQNALYDSANSWDLQDPLHSSGSYNSSHRQSANVPR